MFEVRCDRCGTKTIAELDPADHGEPVFPAGWERIEVRARQSRLSKEHDLCAGCAKRLHNFLNNMIPCAGCGQP